MLIQDGVHLRYSFYDISTRRIDFSSLLSTPAPGFLGQDAGRISLLGLYQVPTFYYLFQVSQAVTLESYSQEQSQIEICIN